MAKSNQQFSKWDQNKADLVRCFQHVSGLPSDATLIYSAETNGIMHNTITKQDVKMTLEM